MKHLKLFENYTDELHCLQVLIDEYDFTHQAGSNSIWSDKVDDIRNLVKFKSELIASIKKLKSIDVDFVLELEANIAYINNVNTKNVSSSDANIFNIVNGFFEDPNQIFYVAFHIRH